MTPAEKPHLSRLGGNWYCGGKKGVVAVSPSMRVAYSGWLQIVGGPRENEMVVTFPNPLRLP